MRSIYIVLTFTGTALSRLVKIYTKKEYGHVSIALDKELEEMYSFGRLNPYNPIIGGFIHEYIHRGTFYRFRNTTAQVVRVRVSDEQYEKLKVAIKKIEDKKDEYKFNVLGLFAVSLNIPVKKDKCLYCAEFVKQVLQEAEIIENLPEVIKPEHFLVLPHKEIYKGFLRDYRYRVKYNEKELKRMDPTKLKLVKGNKNIEIISYKKI